MLNQSYTAVVERVHPLKEEFATEPYEAGWAREAVIFIKVREELDEEIEVHARVQISPDGIEWVDEGTVFSAIREKGLYFVKVTNFGNWLRVSGHVSKSEVQVKALVYITLKG